MGFFGNKERDVEKLIHEHISLVEQALSALCELWEAYFKGKEKYLKLSKKIHDLEHEADVVRRKIEIKLHEGAFLAMFREDFMAFAEAIDRVANKAESVADSLTLEHPEIPEDWHEEFLVLVQASVDTFRPFRKIERLLGEGLDKILKVAGKIEEMEQSVDKLEWRLLQKIFDSEMKLARKLQLRDMVKRIAAVSDKAEDASDRLEILVVKRRI